MKDSLRANPLPKRFYVEAPLAPGATVPLPEALSHRLRTVLRKGFGESLHLFNSQDGLFEATLGDKKLTRARILAQISAPAPLPRKVLAVGTPKREAWETVLRQATEMGVTEIIPLKTRFAQVEKPGNTPRQLTMLAEAAEQCERLCLPTVAPPRTLEDFLATLHDPCAWAYERDAAGGAPNLAACHLLLVGPEGGFAPEEVATLSAHPHIVPFSLGPTILRVDTAVVAGLSRIA